jgi:AbrB family looped-hinge helix DNA binding protein
MALAQSKVTSQGQISVPAEVRQKLGIGPGTVLEWSEEHGRIVVRRAGRISSEEIHLAVFSGKSPPARSVAEMKAGVRLHLRKRHARH